VVDGRDVFHTYDQMVADLQQIASTYPLITRLYNLGRSVQERIIYGLKITDNPTAEENEPEFRIIGAHHGNEKMSAEVPLEMCWYLTQNYGTNPLVTHLVDEREIWIVPIMNVDGHVANSRYNSNNVDLNRDYGYVWGPGWTSPSPYSQPETKAIRNHAFNSTFGLSLSFHCSGDVVNYVWNYKPEHTVDDALVYDFSVDYAAHNGYWVVEGYDWYQTRGDTNDFSYGCRGDIDWTIEIQSSNFAQAWSLNRDAILEMMNNQDIGLKGIVTDGTTGLPLKATVWTEPNFWPCFTDPVVGDYHRLLLPGDYTVHFQANGYEEQIHTVHITDATPVTLNVALSPGGNRYAYQIVWAYIYDPYPSGGGSNFINNPTEVIAALGPNDGQFASLGKGGSVCVDMAESGEILNGPENDLTVYEGETPEGYTVYVSQTGEWSGTWVSLGSATGTASFDLATGGVQRARYVKILDDNVGNAYETNPGFDLDSIQTLHAVQTNSPPSPPSNPNPPDDAHNVSINADLNWSPSTDPDGDPVTYDVFFGNASPLPIVSHNQSETTYDPGTMSYNTIYYWKIVSWDNHGASSSGPVWIFTTESWICGDVNNDSIINVADVVYLTNYLFIGGPAPVPMKCVGDCNGDGIVNISDVVYLINYLFINGPPPGGCCR
jgi:carboxypeptidase D